MQVLNQETNEIFTFENSNNEWFFKIESEGVACISTSISGDFISYEDLDIKDVIVNVSEVLTALESWYNERNDTNFSFSVAEDAEETINRGFSHLRDEILEKLRGAYTDTEAYNEDVIIEKDGTVRTHTYFGSVDYRDSDIVHVISVTSQDKSAYMSMIREGLSEEDCEELDKRGWLSLFFPTNHESYEEWSESDRFEADDDDSFQDQFEKEKERYWANIMESGDF